MRTIYVPISPEDLAALVEDANRDRRRPSDQAAMLLTEALRRRRDRGQARRDTAAAR